MSSKVVKIIVGFLFLSYPFASLGQDGKCILSSNTGTKDIIYAQVDSMPHYPGTEEEFYNFLSANFDWPHHYTDNEILMVTFVVAENGDIQNIKLKRKSKRKDVNEDLLAALEKMAKWIPGRCNGKAVKVEYILPIKIGLN